MSTRSLIARVSTIESNVDTLQSKADSENAVLTGTTSINGPVLLNGPVSLTSTINGITKSMVGLGNVNNTSDKDKPVSNATINALNLKADSSTTYTKGEVNDGLNLKTGGSGTIYYLPKFTDTRVVANSCIQETPLPK